MAAKKKLKINPKKTLSIALSIIGICVLMLFASIILTQNNTTTDSSKTQVTKSQKPDTKKTASVEKTAEKEKAIAKEKAKKANAASDTESSSKPAQTIKTEKNQTSQTVLQVNTQENLQSAKTESQASSASKTASGNAASSASASAKTQTQKSSVTAETKNSAQNQLASAKIQDAEKDKAVTKAPKGSKGYVVLILDDGGNSLEELQKYLSLDMPLTVSVLPHLQHSVESARRVRLAGKELMLHQPMQAVNENIDPGKGAIRPSMDETALRAALAENISQIGPISGMNNHEGSLITADMSSMSYVLDECDNRKIYFVDSRTNKDSVVKDVAQIRGMKVYERNTGFIDDGINGKSSDSAKQKANEATMLARINTGLKFAEKNGSVVMIGHVRSHNLDKILKENYQKWLDEGYAFTTISKSGSKIK